MSGLTLPIPSTPYYGGKQVANPPSLLSGAVSPPSNNAATSAGLFWYNFNNGDLYFSYGMDLWVHLASGASSLTQLSGNMATVAVPTAGNINVVGTGSINVTGAGSTLTITNSAGLSWNSVAASQAMFTNMGYATTGAAAITLTMPSLASVGDQLAVLVGGTGVVTVKQASSTQSIRINAVVPGSTNFNFFSSNEGQSILFICVVASTMASNGSWIALASEGTWNPST